MNINDAFPSKYLRADDLDGDTTYTINDWSREMVGQGNNSEQKVIMSFQETEKTLVLNKTNATSIASQYGPEFDTWIGKQITLFATEVDFQGRQVLAIRVRLKKTKKAAAVAPAKPSAAPAQTPAQRWTEFCTINSVTQDDIVAALATKTVNEWMKTTGKSLDDAFRVILDHKQLQPEFAPETEGEDSIPF